MNGPPSPVLPRVGRFPRLRVLAWSGHDLYASHGYEVVRARMPGTPSPNLADRIWQPVAAFHPEWHRQISAANRLTARLFRDGFHALAVLPSGGLVAAVPRAIVTVSPNGNQFRLTHSITRGTRPLHITSVPSGAIYWGEYFDNPTRDEVHIFASTDGGMTWSVAFTFPRRAIRHVHNIVYDQWGDCLWVLTGDYGDECRILRASCDFGQVETVLQGNQQARAVAFVPTSEGLYFSSDTPLERNYIYHLDRQTADRQGMPSRLAGISSSSIYGCRVADRIFFSTMVEPSAVNLDHHVRIFGNVAGDVSGERAWHSLLAWKKDSWSMKWFQYGNAFLPGGDNATPYLAVTTIGVESDDMATSLYAVGDVAVP